MLLLKLNGCNSVQFHFLFLLKSALLSSIIRALMSIFPRTGKSMIYYFKYYFPTHLGFPLFERRVHVHSSSINLSELLQKSFFFSISPTWTLRNVYWTTYSDYINWTEISGININSNVVIKVLQSSAPFHVHFRSGSWIMVWSKVV